MRNPFGEGLIVGIIGVASINIAEFIMMALNISETPLWEAGGIVFLSEDALQTTLGFAIGLLSHILVGIAVGLAISYYIYFTGTDFIVLKATGVSLAALFFVLGILFPLRGLAQGMRDSPNDVLSAFIVHFVFGIVAGYTVKYLQAKS